MSHEIRTPISGIIGLTEHLLDCNLSAEQTEFANGTLETAKFLLTLINDVLDFSKLESGHMDVESIPFSPEKLTNDVLVPLRLQAKEKGLALTSSCNISPDAIFFGDPWRMRQILTNLIGNSLKFTEKGHVDLTVQTHAHGDVGTVNIEFAVHDSGVGIGEEAMKALFKPFHQADSSTARLHGGTGLGLVICQQLVGLMGGHLTLESLPGEGTTATCNIPFQVYNGPTGGLLKTTPLPKRAKFPGRVDSHTKNPVVTNNLSNEPINDGLPSPSWSASSESKMHILLVEDNYINRKVIALALKKLGYSVATACDGQEALDYLCKTSESPRPNAVLMDCMMPVIDGYEATRRIRQDSDMFDEQVRTLPIIALTASAIKGDKEKCWEAGMDDFLTKPAARDALARTLSKWTTSKALPSVQSRIHIRNWD
jgi:CheY-like chemotaxis protein